MVCKIDHCRMFHVHKDLHSSLLSSMYHLVGIEWHFDVYSHRYDWTLGVAALTLHRNRFIAFPSQMRPGMLALD
jgi:hypothetical protein